ncbi:MAG: CvpA family protein [Eubacteriales bacterium]|nr:CvpA family protein [Eubacteriales bacterium]
MKWLADIAVVAIIAVFGFIGMSKGFFKTVYKIGAFIVSGWIAIKFYPKVSALLQGTSFYIRLKDGIVNNPALQGIENTTQSMQEAIAGLPVPDFLKDLLQGVSGVEQIGASLAELIANIASVIILFIVARLVLMIIYAIVERILKLPVLKQLDKFGGFLLGAVQGLLIVFVLFTVLMLFMSSPQFKGIHDAIDSSIIARYLYEHNFIVKLILPSS